MIQSLLVGFFFTLVLLAQPLYASETKQKIVIMRHGEKPPGGLGQLNCQGLNRSLALPAVLNKKFGKPDEIFAPNPGVKILGVSPGYNYIRPLATIEPTAIFHSMPVNTEYGFDKSSKIAKHLLQYDKHQKLIFVAWEHFNAAEIAKKIVETLGSTISIPTWHGADFDSLYILDIAWGSPTTLQFTHDQEGLNNLPRTCPQGPAKGTDLASKNPG